MYTIYVDEAGTSGAPHEKVAVVGALIVDDEGEHRARAALTRVIQTAPPHYRDWLVPHATEIWNKKKYRDRWDREARYAFLKEMVSIPRVANLPIAMCFVRSSKRIAPGNHFNEIQLRHANAFLYCLARAENYVERYPSIGGARIVAEQVGGYERAMHEGLQLMKTKPIEVDGRSKLTTLEKIRFVQKGEESLIPIIDSVVFAWRRWLEVQKSGEELVENIFPPFTHLGHYLPRSPQSFEAFELDPKTYPGMNFTRALRGNVVHWEATGVVARDLERMSSARHPIKVSAPTRPR
jgi:hypothetical protein